MTTRRAERAPKGLLEGGRKLWNRIVKDFEPEEHERSVLLQACRLADNLNRLQAVIDEGEVIIESPQGPKTHPAVVEFRQQSLAFAKVMASLRIQYDDEDEPQRRSGVRGPRQS